MKTHLLLLTLLIAGVLPAQEFCNYNAQYSIDFGTDSRDRPFEVLELPDGKYVIAGTSYYISPNVFEVSVCRMNSDGTIDLSFGENGRVRHTWDSRNNCLSAALQSDNKILVGGYQAPGNGVSTFRPYVARLNEDGSVDTEFGTSGSAVLEISPSIIGTVVEITELENGKIQAALITQNPRGIAVVQLNEDGSYDESYSDDGIALYTDDRIIWQTEYGDAIFMEDGSVLVLTKILEGGFLKPLVGKIAPDGLLDPAFGENGIATYQLNIQDNYAGIHGDIDNQGNIIFGTTSASVPKKYQVSKISSVDGALDADFGEDGVAYSSSTDSFNAIDGIMVNQTDNTIYAVGTSSESGWYGAVWRLDENGIEEPHCDGGAMYIFPFQFTDGIQLAKIFSDGSLKLIGTSSFEDPTSTATAQTSNFYIPISTSTGINNVDEAQLSIYPNPVEDYINIRLSENLKIESYKIRNQLGQIIQSSNQSHLSINTSRLSPGVYFLELNSSNGTAVRKFMKQ